METIAKLESKEPNKEEIKKILKQNLIKLFSQVKNGCKRKICYNLLCANNYICKNKIKTLQDANIFKNLIEINEELNKKYNEYDHLDKLKCVDNIEILEIEKKFENFTIDINYDYGVNLLEEKQDLPKINLDLARLIDFHKNQNYSVEDLIKEIKIMNEYFANLTKSVDLEKVESLREKSIVYYLYYFMNRCFFYVCMNKNFYASKENAKIFNTFFNNFLSITNCAKLYLENDIENSSMVFDDEFKMNSEILKKINTRIYNAFDILKKYPKELQEFLTHCHNFLSLLLFSIDQFRIIDDKDAKVEKKNKACLMHDRYLKGPIIGRGSFAIIKECFDLNTRKTVAIKEFKWRLAEGGIDKGIKGLFESEVSTMQKIPSGCRNVIRMIESWTEEMKGFIVFECFHYGTVDDLINRAKDQSPSSRIPVNQVRVLFKNLITGMKYLLDNGMHHLILNLITCS